MSNWIPTNELRFVVREEFHGLIKILQQKWLKPSDYTYFDVAIDDEYFTAKWRDVPVVEEE